MKISQVFVLGLYLKKGRTAAVTVRRAIRRSGVYVQHGLLFVHAFYNALKALRTVYVQEKLEVYDAKQ